jgi:butyryl-CoA dehydrogenase
MDFQPNEEQEMLRETARNFAEKELRPIAFTHEDRGEYPREIYLQMGEIGLLGMTLPEAYGGGGRAPVDAIMVMEEVGRVDPLAAGIVFGANFGPIRAVAVYGTDSQKRKYIPPVCRGKLHVDRHHRADRRLRGHRAKTRAVLDGDHYLLNGAKSFISEGNRADAFMVYCRFGEGSKASDRSS